MISNDSVLKLCELLQIRPRDVVLLIGDSENQGIIRPLAIHLKKEHNVKDLSLDDYDRPLSEVPKIIASALTEVDVVFYSISKKTAGEKGEVVFRRKLNQAAELANARVGNLIDMTPEALETGLSCETEATKELTERLYNQLFSVKKLRITCPAGTDVELNFDRKHDWVSSTGFVEPGKSYNILPAEVFTYPSNVEGKIVIAGSYSHLSGLPQFNDKKALLERIRRTPIIWDVKRSRIINVICEDKEIEDVVKEQVFNFANGDIIGEFGMGTNQAIKQCLGIVMFDEKCVGVHFANGDPLGGRTGATYTSPVHNDGIILKPTVVDVDTNKTIMDGGQYFF